MIEISDDLSRRGIDPAVEAELASLLDRVAAETEARWRSVTVNVLVTLAALFVAVGPRPSQARFVFGGVAPAASIAVAAVAWGLFEVATTTFHLLGPKHALTVFASTLDSSARSAALLVLIYLSGSAASAFWVVSMIHAFAWTAKAPGRAKFEFAWLLATHVALVVVFLVERHAGDAWLTLLVLLASTAGHTMSARMVARSARVRAERDVVELRLREANLRRDRERMAREIHDGVGADVMALVLRLRHAAEGGADPKAARLAAKARDLLDELRGVVWSLRNEQGTLAELGKLIDATCRAVRGDVAYERTTPLEAASERIGPKAALEALSAARELVRAAAARSDVTRVALTLSVGSERVLALTVEDDAGPLAGESRKYVPIALDPI